MKRSLKVILLLVAAFSLTLSAQPGAPKKLKPPCKPTLSECPDEGCGTEFDANLNRRKNVRSDNQAATLRTLTWMKKLDDPEDFKGGDSREELSALGEGQKITVVAYLLVAKPELGGESCNCGLHTAAETDNHLVLASKTTVEKFPVTGDEETDKQVFHSRELESLTAEFTPRVRLTHPNFTKERVQPLIDDAPQEALLVRVTGLLLFDSEHFLKNHLVRVNNWEIHPVLKLDICQTANTCKAGSDAGWKSLDELP